MWSERRSSISSAAVTSHTTCVRKPHEGVAPRAHEQLALVALLTADPDPEVAAAANATLGIILRPQLRGTIRRAGGDARVLCDAGDLAGGRQAAEADKPLLDDTTGTDLADDEDDEKSPMQRP
jgi:hypothetical protein